MQAGKTFVRRRAWTWTAVGLAAAVTLAACGSDNSTARSTATTAATAQSTATTGSTGSTATTAGGSAATTAAAASRTGTVKVGLLNTEGGAISVPEFRIGAQVAFDKINATGGINGAKIETVVCLTDGTPESSVNCANKMVEAKVAVVYAAIDLGTDAMFKILADAKIPHVSQTSWGSAVKTDPNTHIIGSANDAFFYAAFKTFADKGAKHAAIFVEDSPAGRLAIDQMAVVAQKFGMDATKTLVDAANPDWLAAVSSGVTGQTDMVYSSLTEAGCISMVKALRQKDFKGSIVAGSCTAYMAALGKDSIGTFNHIDIWVPDSRDFAPAKVQKQIDEYLGDMKAAKQDQYIGGYAAITYAAAHNLVSAIATVPAGTPLDATSIGTALSNAKGIPGFMGGDLDCTKKAWKSEPVACRGTMMIYEVTAGPGGAPLRKPLFSDMLDASTLQ